MRVVSTLLAAVVLLQLGCSGQESAPVGVTAMLTVAPELRNRRLTIAGTTDLPDGAILMYEARHENWVNAGEPVWLRAGQVVVQDGAYSERLNLRRWPPGTIEVWVSFQTVLLEGSQPPTVLETYGAMGERLIGENVTSEGTMHRVDQTATVEPEPR